MTEPQHSLLAIDPGYRGDGNACAHFAGGVLDAIWFERVKTFKPGQVRGARRTDMWQRSAGSLDLVLWERPEYQGERSDLARTQDIINLCCSGALLAGAFAGRDGCPIIELTPTEWKGSEPKPVQHNRMWKILSAAERKVLGGAATFKVIRAALEKGAMKRWKITGADCYPKSFTMHNLLDAAALGCHYLERLPKVG